MRHRFDGLVQAHKDRLFSLAVHLLGNAAEAEDVVQEVLIKLWDHMDKLDEERIRPWLLRVTRNACIDLIRKRSNQQQYAQAAGAETETMETTTPADALHAADLNEELGAAIGGLDEPFQSLIVLREIEGLSYQEIAEALELNDQQVRVYLHRARRKLRHRLTPVMAAAAP